MIQADEVAALLRRVVTGHCAAQFVGELGAGTHVDLVAEGWVLRFFDDAGCLDYLEYAEAPDGRTASYHDFADQDADGWRCPLDSLGIDQERRLEHMWPATCCSNLKLGKCKCCGRIARGSR